MKIINYRGMTFEVEDHFKYIATDDDGAIWVYENNPEIKHGYWLVVTGDCKLVKPNTDWEDSLENI